MMTQGQFIGLFLVWMSASIFILFTIAAEFRRVRFNFNLLFSVLFFLTYYCGFPLTCLLAFQFDVQSVPAEYLLQTQLIAFCFYAVYYFTYKVRLSRQSVKPRLQGFTMTRVETQLTCLMLAAVALVTVAIFFMHNGLLLFRLTAYNQIFSRAVAGVALKRFFYFFIPAMLLIYFLREDKRGWYLFLLSTVLFGLATYVIVGGTRANVLIAFSLFLFIGIARGWISLSFLMMAGALGVVAMFGMALRRYGMSLSGRELIYTFLYLTRDTFSPWENLALLLQHYSKIEFQGLAPLARDFYVYIPGWLWPDKPSQILNSANYFTWEVLFNHSGLAISPTLLGSLVVMGGGWLLLPGAIAVGLIIKGFDWLYEQGRRQQNRYKAAVIQSFCFGAVFNLIVLAREGLDAFGSRIVFFALVFGACLLTAKLIYWFFLASGLVRPYHCTSYRER